MKYDILSKISINKNIQKDSIKEGLGARPTSYNSPNPKALKRARSDTPIQREEMLKRNTEEGSLDPGTVQ